MLTFLSVLQASISAGMLIYASTVEMLAGDFVMDKEIKLGQISKQAIALGSLILGAVTMGILG
jgi:solute carrier family 39 (zinc transporter), member 1/2/3